MAEVSVSQEQVLASLGAMKAVAQANGVFDGSERALLTTAAELFGVAVDVDQLAALTPEALAAAVTDPVWRQRLVQALVVVAVIDGEASHSEVRPASSKAEGGATARAARTSPSRCRR